MKRDRILARKAARKTRINHCPVTEFWDPGTLSIRTGIDLMEGRAKRRLNGEVITHLRGGWHGFLERGRRGSRSGFASRTAWRASLFTPEDRDRRRALRDKKFARALARKQARDQHLRDLALHVARMYNLRVKRLTGPSSRGDIEYGAGAKGYTEWRGGRPKRYHAAKAGVTVSEDGIHLFPVRGRGITLPLPPQKLIRSWAGDIMHASGLFACTTDRKDVVACFGVGADGGWVLRGYSIRGVSVPERVARGQYSLADALAEPNIEVRRIMLESLPAQSIISDMTAIHHDDFGTLYRENDSGITILKVLNATPEPDGTCKDYFLRVPPHVRTAKEAVAWTFGLTPEEYQPAEQS